MQWHDDTFDLPDGAVPLLTGTACRNQAFRVAEVVYGFQCHFEADRQDMVDWAAYRRDVYGQRTSRPSSPSRHGVHGTAAEALRPAGRRPLARPRRNTGGQLITLAPQPAGYRSSYASDSARNQAG